MDIGDEITDDLNDELRLIMDNHMFALFGDNKLAVVRDVEHLALPDLPALFDLIISTLTYTELSQILLNASGNYAYREVAQMLAAYGIFGSARQITLLGNRAKVLGGSNNVHERFSISILHPTV